MSEVSNQHSMAGAFASVRQVLGQGERAMHELGWTQANVMVQSTLGEIERKFEDLEEQLEAQREVVKTFLDKFVDEHGYWVGLDDAETRTALVPLRGCFFPVRMASASNPAKERP